MCVGVAESRTAPLGLVASLRSHWPEYAIEAAGLGLFMVSACGFGTLLEHPDSRVHQAIGSPFLRRALMGMAMGGTAIGIIYSRWGKRSGAHLNPATTWAFLRVGHVRAADALFYTLAQFAGGAAGVLLMAALLGSRLAHPSVNYVATVPGMRGPLVAFLAEVAMTFILMTIVLTVSSRPRWARWTGVCAGILVATYIAFEAPVSGMSLNPARTFASSVVAQFWKSPWVYFLAPVLGMQLAALAHLHRRAPVACAKLHHENTQRCIFCETAPRP